MKRFALLGLAALVVVGVAPGAASARGGEWVPAVATPFDTACGNTTVHVSFPVNKEYEWDTVLPDGTVQIKITGSVRQTLATDAGKSVTVNVSGPVKSMFDAVNGDYDFIATGQNGLFLTADQSAATGLPQVLVVSGPLDVLFRADGTVQLNRINRNTITDLCKVLGAS
jgi:hypothetical protein